MRLNIPDGITASLTLVAAGLLAAAFAGMVLSIPGCTRAKAQPEVEPLQIDAGVIRGRPRLDAGMGSARPGRFDAGFFRDSGVTLPRDAGLLRDAGARRDAGRTRRDSGAGRMDAGRMRDGGATFRDANYASRDANLLRFDAGALR